MSKVADLNTKFGDNDFRPMYEEIDLCRDHALEVEEQSPDNPVDPKLFTDPRWKAMQKARTIVAEAVTHNRHGQLSMDPKVMEEQLITFEIIERGWCVQGKESCRGIQC